MSAAARSTRRTVPPASKPAAPPAPTAYELVDIDRYAVFDDELIGYVEVVPPLFICYSGHPYPKAVEVAQVFDFDQALLRVKSAAARPSTPHDHGFSAA